PCRRRQRESRLSGASFKPASTQLEVQIEWDRFQTCPPNSVGAASASHPTRPICHRVRFFQRKLHDAVLLARARLSERCKHLGGTQLWAEQSFLMLRSRMRWLS